MSKRRTLEFKLEGLLNEWQVHQVFHALVEVFYRRAGECADDYRRHDNWRDLARGVTILEDRASHLDL